MKISEVIEELQKIHGKHGDLDVLVLNEGKGSYVYDEVDPLFIEKECLQDLTGFGVDYPELSKMVVVL